MIVFNRISEILFESLESFQWYDDYFFQTSIRGGSRTTTTSKMEHFVIIVNGWKPLTIITKSSILDAAAVLDPSLYITKSFYKLGSFPYGLQTRNKKYDTCLQNSYLLIFLYCKNFSLSSFSKIRLKIVAEGGRWRASSVQYSRTVR